MSAQSLPAPLLFDLPATEGGGLPRRGPAEAWRPTSWPFGCLAPGRYRLIMADPPWSFDNYSIKGEAKNPKAHYACMPLPAIQALPVGQLAHRDGCLLWMWATWAMLPQAQDTLRAWGFRHVTGAPWQKKTRHGRDAFGTGYVFRVATEPFLIGAIGSPPYGPAVRSERGLMETCHIGDEPLSIEAAVREHSRKPDEQYAKARRLIPSGPACELFARQAWPGFEVWGNQTAKFEPASMATAGEGGA